MYPNGITNIYSIKANKIVCKIPGDILRVTIIAAKKTAPTAEKNDSKDSEVKDKDKNKTLAEADREKLEKKFSKKKGKKLN